MNEELTKGTIVPDIDMGNSSSSIGTVVPDINAGGGIQTAPAVSTTTSPAKDYFKSFGINTDGGKLTDEAWESIYYTVNSNKNKNKSDVEKIGIIKKEVQDRLNPGLLAKTVSGISKATSNLPEKMAGVLETVSTPISQLPNNISNLVNSITGKGEQIDTSIKSPIKNYEEIKAVFDPNQTVIVDKSGKPLKNGEFIQNIVQGSQDALGRIVVAGGLQSIPGFGQALSSAYWSAISADERLQKNGGKLGIKDIAPILIDTIGDSIIGNQIGRLLGLGGDVAKNTAKMIEQSTLVEGGTEVAQTILKNVYDIATARNQEERKEKWEELKQYFTDPKHGVALEFLVGAISGGVAGAGAGALGQMAQNAGVDMTAKPYTPQEIADMTKDTIGGIKQQQEVRTQAKAIQNKDSAIRGIANDMLGNKTKGGNLENSPIDVASKHLTNVFGDMTLEQMENIIKGGEKTAYKTFGREYNKSYNEVQNKINETLSRPVIMNTTIDGTTVIDELLSDDGDLAFQRKQLQAEAQNAINQGEIETRQNDDGTITYVAKTKSGERVADELNSLSDDIVNKRRKYTIGEIEQLRKDYNRGFKPNGQPYTDYEKAIGRKFISKMRDLMYDKVNEIEPGFRELAEKRADYEAMRRLLERAVAKEDTYNESGSGFARGAIEGAMRTIDPADAIFALTPGGLTRTGVEALFGAIMGAVRSKKNAGKNLIKNMKTLYNAKAVEDLTNNTINSAGKTTTMPAVRNVDMTATDIKTNPTQTTETESQNLIQQTDQPLQIENSSRKKFYTNEEFNNLMKQEDERFNPITTQKIKGKNVKISPDQLRMFKKSDGNQANGVLSDNIKTKITELFNRRGVEVSFEELPSDVDAMWSMDENGNRSVKFNVNNESDKTIYNTAIHELVHDIGKDNDIGTLRLRLEELFKKQYKNAEKKVNKLYKEDIDGSEKLWEEYRKFKRDNFVDIPSGHAWNTTKLASDSPYTEAQANKIMEELSEKAGKQSKRVDNIISEEVTAELLAEVLASEDMVDRLVKYRPSYARKIYSWIINKLDNLLKTIGVDSKVIALENARNMFSEAFANDKHRTDTGHDLNANMDEFLKNSYARENENLDGRIKELYHTTKPLNTPFSEFSPNIEGKDENYKFNDNFVTYLTDDYGMSQTYGGDNTVDVKWSPKDENFYFKDKNLEEAKKTYNTKIKNLNKKYPDIIKLDTANENDTKATLTKKLNDAKFKTDNLYATDMGYTYSVYANIQKPLIIEGYGNSWNLIPFGVEPKTQIQKNALSVNHSEVNEIVRKAVNKIGDEDVSEQNKMNSINGYLNEKISFLDENGNVIESTIADLDASGTINNEINDILSGDDISESEASSRIYNVIVKAINDNNKDIYISEVKTTNDIVKEAIKSGKYDGVIFKDIIDYASYRPGLKPSNVYAVFNPNQIKHIDNDNPTSDPDIRYKKSSK